MLSIFLEGDGAPIIVKTEPLESPSGNLPLTEVELFLTLLTQRALIVGAEVL